MSETGALQPAAEGKLLAEPSGEQMRDASGLSERLSQWAPLTVVRGRHGSGKAIEVAAWLESRCAEEVTWAWVTARPVGDGVHGFERCLSRSLRAGGLVPSDETYPATCGLGELDAALLRVSSDQKFVLVVDQFHYVEDERILERLVDLLRRHRHLHLCVCCRKPHRIETLATGAVRVNAIDVDEPSPDNDGDAGVARAIVALLDQRWAERVHDEVEAWVRTIPSALTVAEKVSGKPADDDVVMLFQRAAASGDRELLDRLWTESLTPMIDANAGLVCETLTSLGCDVLSTRPSMQVMGEVLKVAVARPGADGRRAATRAFADGCARLIRQHWETMSANDVVLLATGALIQLRLLGRFEEAARFGERVDARVNAITRTEQIASDRLAWFHLQRSLMLLLSCERARAVRSYQLAWEHAAGSGLECVRSRAAADLALTYALGGDTAQASEWLGRHRSLDTRGWPGDDDIALPGRLASGFLALDRLDDAAVRSALDGLGDGSAPTELWPFVAYLHAQQALHDDTALEGLAHLYQLQDVYALDLSGKGAAASLMTRATADLLIACGQGEKAQQLLDNKGIGEPLNRVPVARIRLLDGRESLMGFIGALTRHPATSTRDRLELFLIGAIAALREECAQDARRLMNHALELYRSTGVVRPFATIPAKDLARLLKLAGRSLEPHDTEVLASQLPVYPDGLALIELSAREHAVLGALVETGSRHAIAESLFVSVNTVKTQLSSIYRKLGTTSREETLLKARDHGLVP